MINRAELEVFVVIRGCVSSYSDPRPWDVMGFIHLLPSVFSRAGNSARSRESLAGDQSSNSRSNHPFQGWTHQYGLNLAAGPPPLWKSLLTLPASPAPPFIPTSPSSSASSHASSLSSSSLSKNGKEEDWPLGKRESCSAEQADRASNRGCTVIYQQSISMSLSSKSCQSFLRNLSDTHV